MTLDIETALTRGFSRTVARNGLVLVAITYLLNLVNSVTGPQMSGFPGGPGGPLPGGVASPQPLIPVPLFVDGLLSVIVGLAGMVVTIGALRHFADEETESLSAETFTRNGVWALLNFIAGSIVFGIVVVIGFVLLIVPGVFLLTTLFYWPVFVAVEDENFAEALQSSWELTKGRRIRVFILGVVFVVVGFLINLVFGIPSVFLGPAGVVISGIGTAFTAIFGNAVLVAAYRQLEADDEPDEPGPTPAVADYE